MITGYNTDVDYNKKVYHVQTEDKGLDNPHIESLIYMGGAIVFSKRTGYADKLESGITEKEIRALMENQHRTIIAAIKKGRFGPDGAILPESAPAPPPPPAAAPPPTHADPSKAAASAPAPSSQASVATTRTTALQPAPGPAAPPPSVTETPSKASLDEMIKAYLIQEKEKDTLDIKIPHATDFYAGSVIPFAIKAETSVTHKAIPGVEIVAKLITTFGPPQDLFTGYTSPEGSLTMTLRIPAFKHGNAAVIIMGKSKEYGNTEYKQLVKKKN